MTLASRTDMENWQLALVILVAVVVGALVPVFIMLSLTLHRAGKEIAAIGNQLRPTLSQIQIISDRVETLSRGLEGGEQSIAELLAVVGDLARGLERNMKIINFSSAVVAAVGPAVAAFIKTMSQPKEPDNPGENDGQPRPGDDQSGAASPESTEPTEETKERKGK
jgi:uncharacterized protein YoxC